MQENKDRRKIEKHVFICTKCQNTDFCHNESYALELQKELKMKCKESMDMNSIRINAAGCLGVCDDGIHAVIYPENKWFKKLSKESIPSLIEYIKSNT